MKISQRSNWRVEIEIEKPYAVTIAECREAEQTEINKKWRTVGDDVAAQVRRHVDGGEYAMVKWDSREVCSFCRRDWETEEDSDAPACCGAAVAEFDGTDTGGEK